MPATEVLTVHPDAPDAAAIAWAAEFIRAGGLVAFPTETVYGLGADALSPVAVERLYAAKGRPAGDPIIVHVLDEAGLEAVAAQVGPDARRLVAAFWPGPLTLVVPRGAAVPAAVSAGLDSVAVRAPAHAVARALIAAAGTPIAAPSANRFGHVSPTTAAHVVADLGGRIDLVLDGGPTTLGIESTVVDCRERPLTVLRPGGVTLEALRDVVGRVDLATAGPRPGPARSPGRLARHYAPRARLVVVAGAPDRVRDVLGVAATALASEGRRVGLLVATDDLEAVGGAGAAASGGIRIEAPGPLDPPDAVARGLFAALRRLDEAGVEVILARDFGEAGLALAVRDRLARAAEGRLVLTPPGDAGDLLRLARG